MSVRVYRGFDLGSGLNHISWIVLIYAGVFAVLWALGLVVRGWQGWLLVIAPLVMIVSARMWAWRRISVELADGILRYEGTDTEHDFEVPLASIASVYADEMLRGRPLVLVLVDGGERVLEDLRPSVAEALREHLVGSGVDDIRKP